MRVRREGRGDAREPSGVGYFCDASEAVECASGERGGYAREASEVIEMRVRRAGRGVFREASEAGGRFVIRCAEQTGFLRIRGVMIKENRFLARSFGLGMLELRARAKQLRSYVFELRLVVGC